MEDRELYQQVLCLESPWTVSQVELNADTEEVRIQVVHPRGTKFCCPECDRDLACYDHAEQRCWRHLDSRASAHIGIAGKNREIALLRYVC